MNCRARVTIVLSPETTNTPNSRQPVGISDKLRLTFSGASSNAFRRKSNWETFLLISKNFGY